MKKKTGIGITAVAAAGIATGALLAIQIPTSFAGELNEPVAESTATPDEALQYAIEVKSSSSADGNWFDRHLSEVLPNQLYSVDGAEAAPFMGGVFLGTVSNVELRASYIDSIASDGDSSTEQTEIDDPNASWRLLVVTLDVENDFDPNWESPQSVQIAVPIGGGADAELMTLAFEDRELLVVADKLGSYPFDDSLYAAGHAGQLIGFVDQDGGVSMPFLGEDYHPYVEGVDTVEAIAAEAEKSKPVIDLVFGNAGIYFPAD